MTTEATARSVPFQRRNQTTEKSSMTRRRSALMATVEGYAFLLPSLVLVVGLIYVSIAANIVYSTWQWNGVSPTHQTIGFDNYIRLAADPTFWRALANTLLFGLIAVFTQLLLGFALAVLVRTRSYGTGLLRTLLFVPVVLSPAVVATSFRLLLTPDGQFNELLRLIGVPAEVPWVADPNIALFSLAVINIWQYTGYSFVIYDAALGQLDASVLEAARVDGASTGQLIRHIVFPLLRGSHLILIVLGFIGALKTFELVFLITGGGPGTSTEFLTTYIYRQVVTQFNAGYGAALSMALVGVALLFAVLQVRLTRANNS
ncbi:sugar ABC transporter permease [Microbacterium sp. 4R-513]|uniref:carbohydrate ABC transporter permease n=1 Tax=Microbacterium sp. 4R-513 TaxID=2567934 RepID=UPI0013E1269E|nr:sugar ABC transporter permease [Microbacterium sp. 4R-513]QIG39378.1 sugar ABC transporter permease [Microbacterium sp. 4R-513]